MKVLMYSMHGFEKGFYESLNTRGLKLTFTEEHLDENSVQTAKGYDAISVFSSDTVSAKVLEELKDMGIQYISTRSAGYNHIDLENAEKLDIKVAYVPAYSPYSVAEHTVALMLALNRRLIKADQKVKAHDFSVDNLIGFDMHKKQIGLLGLGKIGSVLAKILHGFGSKIFAYDLIHNPELGLHYDISFEDLDFIFKYADIISLQLPLTELTHHIINEEAINKMKDGVMIINTGRGALLDTKAVIKGLKSGKIGFLGLDVYEHEANLFHQNHSEDILLDDDMARLMAFNNVLITSHQGFLTNEALHNIADGTVKNLNSYRKGEVPVNRLC